MKWAMAVIAAMIYVASPYLSLYELSQAVRDGDARSDALLLHPAR